MSVACTHMAYGGTCISCQAWMLVDQLRAERDALKTRVQRLENVCAIARQAMGGKVEPMIVNGEEVVGFVTTQYAIDVIDAALRSGKP